MNRPIFAMMRFVLLSVCVACLRGSLAVAADPAPAAPPPNLLFAIADDWGAHAGAYGTKWVQTPAFDRVAREGILFTLAYTPIA